YIYFNDKEALLHQLAMPPLLQLKQELETISQHSELLPEGRLTAMTRELLHFCFLNRNMYELFFMIRSTRVDVAEPETELNRVRNAMFALLMKAVQECVPPTDQEQLMMLSRIFFYTLQGMIGTYTQSEESATELMERLEPTFIAAVEVLVIGFNAKVQRRSEG